MNLNIFKEKYIDVDYDKLLTDNNNILVNSNEHYLEYKNTYIQDTLLNFNLLSEYMVIYDKLHVNYKKDEIKKIYKYIYRDEIIYKNIKNKIKELIIEQNKIYNNLINHIAFLNNHATF